MNRDTDEGFLSRWARRKAQVRQGKPPDEPAPVRPPVPTAATAGLATRGPEASPQRDAGPPLAGDPLAAVPTAATAPAAAATAPTSAEALAEASAQAAPAQADAATPPPPPPTLDDVAQLAQDASDFSRFVAPEVPTEVRHAALRKMFSQPHFNVMDGLDIYIDDYSRPDPLPSDMLSKMAMSQFLGLFTREPASNEAAAAATAASGAADTPAAAAGTPAADNRADAAAADAAAAPAETAAAADATDDPALTDGPEARTDEDPDLRLQPHDAAGREGVAGGTDQDPGRRA